MTVVRRFVRFRHRGRWNSALLEDGRIFPLRGSVFGRWEKVGNTLPLADVSLGPPCRPSKIVAIGVNYHSHMVEMGHDLPQEPKLFLTPSTAVIGPGDLIRYPTMSSRVDYEAELGVVIGRRAKGVDRERALDYVFGYSCFNDVTARDLQRRDGQWTRGKSFDTFAPLGPAVVTGLDPTSLVVESYLNGRRRQSAPIADLIFDIPLLVHFISQVMTLLPGDVIATGTPSGVGPMVPGDEIEIRIPGLGSLKNGVAARAGA